MIRATNAPPIHQVVLSHLCDLQARLRGDPATLVLARGPAHIDDGSVPIGGPSPVAPDDALAQLRLAELHTRLAGFERGSTSVVDLQRTIDRRLRDS